MPGSKNDYASRVRRRIRSSIVVQKFEEIREKSHALDNFIPDRTRSSCKLSVGSAFGFVRDKAMKTEGKHLHVDQTTANAMHSPQDSPNITNIDEGSQKCGSQDVHYQLTVGDNENAPPAGVPSFEGLEYNIILASLGINMTPTSSLQTNVEGLNASPPSRPRC